MARKILVIGASGMLGTDLVQRLGSSSQVVCAADDRGDFVIDITRPADTMGCMKQASPDAVVLTAAYTNVDGCETDPETAHRINAYGAGVVASVCAKQGIPLMYISTDFVFDGHSTEPYTEWAEPAPLGVYGRSKLEGEKWVREVCPAHWIVRTAWLFGRNGKCFPRSILQAAREHKPLRVVSDQVGSPTYTRDLADVLASLIEIEAPFGTYHAVNAGEISWHGFAEEILRQAGIHQSVEPIASDAYPSPTRRPAYSVLSTERLRWAGISPLRPWNEALGAFLAEIRSELNGE